MDTSVQQTVECAMAMGPTVLVQGIQVRRPFDVVRAPFLSVDDNRAILAVGAESAHSFVKGSKVRA